MFKCAEEMSVTWPNISEDIRDFLCDCGCALSKENRRKGVKWGNPSALLPEETSYALDLFFLWRKDVFVDTSFEFQYQLVSRSS